MTTESGFISDVTFYFSCILKPFCLIKNSLAHKEQPNGVKLGMFKKMNFSSSLLKVFLITKLRKMLNISFLLGLQIMIF